MRASTRTQEGLTYRGKGMTHMHGHPVEALDKLSQQSQAIV